MVDDAKKQILRAEATLLRLPIFALAVKGSASLDGFEFRSSRRRGERTVESIIRTERDEREPYPGPLARRVHLVMLSMVADRGFPCDNPITWTWRDLCRRMGLPNSGRRVAELKAAIRATWALKIHGLDTAEGRTHETWHRLYAEVEFMNETKADGTSVSANRLWLAPWYLESLNKLHAAPLDYNLWKRLEKVGPLASRLYEYLVPAFYKRDALEFAYDRLASAMPVVAESRRSHAIRQFEGALQALRAEKVIADATWDAMKGTGRPKLVLTRGALLTPKTADPDPAGQPMIISSVASSAPDLADGAKRLATEFYRLMGRAVRPLKSDLTIARDLIGRHGLGLSLEVLPDAVRRLRARFRNAETMGALVRYFDEALADLQRKRHEEQARVEEQNRLAAERTKVSGNEERRKQIWASLPESWRDAIRKSVAQEQPLCQRFPALLEMACLQSLTLDSPTEPIPATRG